MDIRNKLWMWGYTQEQIGVTIPFSGASASHCSLESAADYFGMPNTVFMNSLHTWDRTEENLAFLHSSRKVICALPHGQQAYIEGARKISELSLRFPQITGAVMDDFLQLSGYPTTPEMVREIKKNLCSANPNLELHVVMYSDLNHLPLEPYLESIDAIMLWRWVSSEHFWRTELEMLLHRFKVDYGKKLFHGVYLQNYGEYGDVAAPMNFELWKLQWMRLLKLMRFKHTALEGCILLQNAWVGNPGFRDHVVWLKDTLDWFYQTTSTRQDN
jgi:hypothetical protein